MVNLIVFDLSPVKCFFLLVQLMGISSKSSVKPEESLSGHLAWLETQIERPARTVVENIAMFEHAAPSFQNAIFSQILIQEMPFSPPPQATAIGSPWLLALREAGETGALG